MLVRGPNVAILRVEVPCFVCEKLGEEVQAAKYVGYHDGIYVPVCEDHASLVQESDYPMIRLVFREAGEQVKAIGKVG